MKDLLIQKQPLKQWAEEDRPREKLLLKGKSSLTNAELLAIVLGSGSRSLSAVELAQVILKKYDNCLYALSRASITELTSFKGVGHAKAIAVFAVMELGRRKSESSSKKKTSVRSSKDAYCFIKSHLTDLFHEEFYVLFLNRANEIIGYEQISKGGISGTIADGKIIFQKALERKSSAIILAHNHPSGTLKASQADLKLTKNLIEFGKLIDLQILDHLIITDDNYLSFADEALM